MSHHVTWFLGTRFPKTIPLIFVVGYPKSGTTWVCQLAADYLQLPFPQFSILPIGCSAVVHGHERASSRYPCGIYVMRDGRDALTSLYFFLTRAMPEGDSPKLSRGERRLFPGLINRDDLERNFTPFLERQMKRPHAAPCNWGDHVRSFYDLNDPALIGVRYEDLHANPQSVLSDVMKRLTGETPDADRIRATVEKFSFTRQAGRAPGHEDRTSFYRKGQVGDWRNYFTIEAAEIFDRYCGEALVLGGYEKDRDWLSRFAASRESAGAPP